MVGGIMYKRLWCKFSWYANDSCQPVLRNRTHITGNGSSRKAFRKLAKRDVVNSAAKCGETFV